MMITPNCASSSDASISGAGLYLEGFEESDAADLFSEPIPDEIPDDKLAESLMTRSIAAMTQTDREDAYYDIHAIHDEKPEDPEQVNKSLELLEQEIMKRDDKEAYLQAMSVNADYVQNREFRLMFLRTDRFDAQKAALRMVRYFQLKLDLFGKERLGKEITQDDMNLEDMGALNDGVQLCPTRDRAGRAILCITKTPTVTSFSMESRLRRIFYLAMVALRDPETRKRGVVCLVSFIGKNTNIESSRAIGFRGMWKVPKLSLCLPIHVAAVHMGYDSVKWTPAHVILRMAFNLFTRVRYRAHYGTMEEWLKSIKSFGIHPAQLPYKSDGSFESESNKQFLEAHRKKERLTYPRSIRVGVPGQYDVLFGKGSRFQNHIGNVKFRAFVADCKKTYEKTRRGEKHTVIQENCRYRQAILRIVSEGR